MVMVLDGLFKAQLRPLIIPRVSVHFTNQVFVLLVNSYFLKSNHRRDLADPLQDVVLAIRHEKSSIDELRTEVRRRWIDDYAGPVALVFHATDKGHQVIGVLCIGLLASLP